MQQFASVSQVGDRESGVVVPPEAPALAAVPAVRFFSSAAEDPELAWVFARVSSREIASRQRKLDLVSVLMMVDEDVDDAVKSRRLTALLTFVATKYAPMLRIVTFKDGSDATDLAKFIESGIAKARRTCDTTWIDQWDDVVLHFSDVLVDLVGFEYTKWRRSSLCFTEETGVLKDANNTLLTAIRELNAVTVDLVKAQPELATLILLEEGALPLLAHPLPMPLVASTSRDAARCR